MAISTARGYQVTLRLFGDYITDPRYGWLGRCEQQFGQVPVKILHEWNTVVHVGDFEGSAWPASADLRRGAGVVRCRRWPGGTDPCAAP
jgi:hypothetical protein